MRKKNKCGVVCDMGHTAQESGCRQAIHVVGVGRQTPGKFVSRQKQRTGRSSCGKGNPHAVKGSRAHFLSAMVKNEAVCLVCGEVLKAVRQCTFPWVKIKHPASTQKGDEVEQDKHLHVSDLRALGLSHKRDRHASKCYHERFRAR